MKVVQVQDLFQEKKPEKGQMPQMAMVATRKVPQVQGIFRHSPPMKRMSCSLLIAWITEPAARKSRPLKKAWVIRWKMPAEKAPTPMARNM